MMDESGKSGRTAWRLRSLRRTIAVYCAVAIVVLAISSCAGPGASDTPTSKVSPSPSAISAATNAATSVAPSASLTYTLAIEASPGSATSIVVSGTTNLPSGGVVHVFASRALRYTDEADIRSTNIANAEVTLSGGTFAVTLALDESNVTVGVDETFPLDIVSQDVTVCAQFETGTDLDGVQRQPDPEVAAAVGAFGEQLATSPQVSVFGSATDHPANWLEVLVDVTLESSVLDEIATLQGRPVEVGPLEGFCVG